MFVVSHEARGASSKPVCELKCSSINFSTAYSPVKTMLCWSEMDGWRGGGAINPKYTNTSNEMSHCKGCRLIYWFPESKAARPPADVSHKQSGSHTMAVTILLLLSFRCCSHDQITGNRYDSCAAARKPFLIWLLTTHNASLHPYKSKSEMSEFQPVCLNWLEDHWATPQSEIHLSSSHLDSFGVSVLEILAVFSPI